MSDRKPIDPSSVRGRLAVHLHSLILDAQNYPAVIRFSAKEQGLSVEQALAGLLTEAVLDIVGLTGDEKVRTQTP